MTYDEDEVQIKGLNQLLKALKAKPPSIRVGIMGSKNQREGSGSNATIGASHELGLGGHPIRSFLRVPITEHLESRMRGSDMLSEETLKEVIRQGTVLPWSQQVAVLAEGIVADAFATGGFGAWAPWKNPNYTNNTGDILKDTQQLSESITSEVRG